MTEPPSLFGTAAAIPTGPPPSHQKEPMPDWMVRRLERAGHIDADTGATRRARAAYCRQCWNSVMIGLTSPPTPWPASCDPAPLDPTGEVLALMAGLRTYELRWVGDRYELERRDNYRIRHLPIATLKGCDVLAEHRCKARASWPTATTKLSDTRAPANTYQGDQPPY